MSATGASGSVDETNKKVLKRDVSLLREFDSSESPDLLVLYYHLKDAQFDCFNAAEYQMQLKQYYDGGIAVVLVAPRKINDHSYLLVCLQNSRPEHNVLCQLAFQCQRQFCGVSLLLKKRCFVCHKPTMMVCTGCQCACFCSRECQSQGWPGHKKLCKRIKSSNVTVEEECIEIEL
mmetsp:Transcript_52/g.104  ORF Transcript_52/g.104 Transcript_52/m.104 type:complete len:176 (-) Transcript_52:477-1004(-)